LLHFAKLSINKSSGEVREVRAPNGAHSALYNDALAYTGNSQAALNIWAAAYTPEFAAFADGRYNADGNGEPLLDDVLHFITTTIGDTLSNADMRDLRNLSASAGGMSPDTFANRMWDAFYGTGIFIVDENRLKQSGLYTEDEIYNILNQSELRDKIRKTLSVLRKTQLSENSSLPEGIKHPAGIVHEARTTVFGKRAAVNPAVVERTLTDVLGGIKDRAAFDQALRTLPYEEIIERYADPDYANALFEHYSACTIIPVVEISDKGLQAYRTANLPFTPFEATPETLSGAIDVFLQTEAPNHVSQADGSTENLINIISRESAHIGVDMTNLPRAYATKSFPDVQDFVASYQTFLNKKNNDFANEYNRFFEIKDDKVSQESGRPVSACARQGGQIAAVEGGVKV
jgi:hypothetical protein